MNNPVKFVDPSGHDPLDAEWVQAFKNAHGGVGPSDQDVRDRLFSLIFLGSGPNGTWTNTDWAKYAGGKRGYWESGNWSGSSTGVERFAVHVSRLASYYQAHEVPLFVQAFAFIWGGVPLNDPLYASLDMIRPRDDWLAYPPLNEGIEGWRGYLVDDNNPAHHYAGLFHTGYFFGAPAGRLVNWFRDGPLSDYNEPDILLGNAAAEHASLLRRGKFSLYALGDVIRASLSVDAYIWPRNYPIR
ncbi:MAG: hypothetical protein ACTSX7_20605 [Alphaproteobacteria bacterium]